MLKYSCKFAIMYRKGLHNMKKRIHIFGASGSGTSSIAKAVCERIGYTHFDTDNYYWVPTDEPFTVAKPETERVAMMNRDLGECEKWVNSGSLIRWGNELIPLFDLVVFVYVPSDVRVERLKNREYERYGDAVLPGGRRYESTLEFIDWAASYDAGNMTGRNLANHEKWLENITCDVLKIENIIFKDSVNAVIDAIKKERE